MPDVAPRRGDRPSVVPSAGRVSSSWRIFRHAGMVAAQDLAGTYTWRSWLAEWVLRTAGSVVFFVLLGRLVDSPDAIRFLLVGNVVVVAARAIFLSVPSTVWERYAGTLPLLVAAPSSPVLVFLGRSVEWIVDGFIASIVALAVLAPVFGVELPWPRVLGYVPVMMVICLSVYMMATFFGSLALRLTDGRNLIGVTTSTSLMVLCGVNVAIEALPGWLQPVSLVTPLTHGLLAVRALLGDGPMLTVVQQVGWEALVGAGWALVTALSFRWFAEGGRRDGSIEFGS
jgi:ABC-2 type transport system permease protein